LRIGLYKNSRLQNSSLGIFQHLATWEYEPVQSSAECKPVSKSIRKKETPVGRSPCADSERDDLSQKTRRADVTSLGHECYRPIAHGIKKRFSVTSNSRYIHEVLNVDKIKN